jgi:hypothetical protein
MPTTSYTAVPVRTTAPTTRSGPAGHKLDARWVLIRFGSRLLVAFGDFCEGASWQPGRDWLTRITPPCERQEPR